MAVKIVANFGNEADMARDLGAMGVQSVDEPKTAPEAAAVPETPSEKPEVPGVTPAAAGDEIDSASEAGKTQEAKVEAEPVKPQPHRGNFKSKIEQKDAQISRLRDEIDLERGDKSRIREKLEKAEAELAALKQPEAAKPNPNELARPKRPTRTELDYDDDKYELAMTEYEAKLDDYNAKLRERDIQKAMEAQRTETVAAEQKRREEAAKKEYETKLQKSIESVPEFEETFANLEEDVEFPENGIVTTAIQRSSNPAALLVFFAKDHLENGGQKLAEIASMDPMGQAFAMFQLEREVLASRAPVKPAEQAAAAVAAPVTPPPQPVPVVQRPKPATSSVNPITPVGARTSAGNGKPSLAEAAEGGLKAYLDARAKGVAR